MINCFLYLDPFLPDRFGAVGDSQAFANMSSSENYSRDLCSLKQNFCNFPTFTEDRPVFVDGNVE